MRKRELEKKATQMLALGVKLEGLINTLPREITGHAPVVKEELLRLIRSVELAAAQADL